MLTRTACCNHARILPSNTSSMAAKVQSPAGEQGKRRGACVGGLRPRETAGSDGKDAQNRDAADQVKRGVRSEFGRRRICGHQPSATGMQLKPGEAQGVAGLLCCSLAGKAACLKLDQLAGGRIDAGMASRSGRARTRLHNPSAFARTPKAPSWTRHGPAARAAASRASRRRGRGACAALNRRRGGPDGARNGRLLRRARAGARAALPPGVRTPRERAAGYSPRLLPLLPALPHWRRRGGLRLGGTAEPPRSMANPWRSIPARAGCPAGLRRDRRRRAAGFASPRLWRRVQRQGRRSAGVVRAECTCPSAPVRWRPEVRPACCASETSA